MVKRVRVTMERAQKRRVEVARTEPGNPFYELPGGEIGFDPVELARPEYQDLLRALHERYKRGTTREPLPFDIFPVRQLPEELLLHLVGGDVRTFVRLAGCQVWPDVALLLSVAVDTELLRQIDVIGNGDTFAEGVLMGVAVPSDEDSSTEDDEFHYPTLHETCTWFVREKNMAGLSETLRQMMRPEGRLRAESSLDWHAFYFFFDRATALRRGRENPLMLPSGHLCLLSDMAAIKLAAEVLSMGVLLGLQWRFTAQWRRQLFPRPELREKYTPFSHALHWLLFEWKTERADKLSNYKRIALLANDLRAALNNAETVMFEFDHYPPSQGYVNEAARLKSLMDRYDAQVEKLLETTGNGDLLIVDLLHVPLLAKQVCALVSVDDCGQFWFDLMKTTWEGYQAEYVRRPGNDISVDAPYQCAECRGTAMRLDHKFGLPFCDSKGCLETTFAKLRHCGLYDNNTVVSQ
jgi:hypothetical protein